jgi:hypothetical protein
MTEGRVEKKSEPMRSGHLTCVCSASCANPEINVEDVVKPTFEAAIYRLRLNVKSEGKLVTRRKCAEQFA